MTRDMSFIGYLLGTSLIGLVVLAYWAPTLTAYCLKQKRITQVAIINGFLGWTFVGWVAALVIALEKEGTK
jgi:hypothetical protein